MNYRKAVPYLFLILLVLSGLASDLIRGGGGGGVTWPLTSSTANPAQSGQIRLANNESIAWRNSANSGDYTVGVDNTNKLTIASALTVNITGGGDLLLASDASLLRLGTSLFSRFGQNGSAAGSFRFVNAGTGATTGTSTVGLKSLPNNTATTFVKITMVSGSQVGGSIMYSIEDLTTRGAIAGNSAFVAQDTGAAITCAVKTTDDEQQTVGGSAGFVNSGFTCADATGNILNLLAKALTTGGTDTLQIRYTLTVNDTGLVAPQ